MLFTETTRMDSKSKRLNFDSTTALTSIEENTEVFNLPCIIYFLHGSKTKQRAFSTKKISLITLFVNTLRELESLESQPRKITFHCSYPIFAVQNASKTTNQKAAEQWVMEKWTKLLPNHLPDRFTFHSRTNPNQKHLKTHDQPGSIEIRLEKSMGAMLAFNHRGETLIQEHNLGVKYGEK